MVYLDHFIPNFVDSGKQDQKAIGIQTVRKLTSIGDVNLEPNGS